MLKLVHDLPVRFCKVSIHPFVLDGDQVSDLHHLFAEDSIKQMLQTFLCSGLPIGTVATFDRQKLPSLPLASNPLVASRFHTTMSRFNAVAEAAQSPPETSQVQADFMRLRFALQSNLSIRMCHDVPQVIPQHPKGEPVGSFQGTSPVQQRVLDSWIHSIDSTLKKYLVPSTSPW